MRKTKEILRLAQESGLSNRQIARSLQISPSTVGQCLKRAETAGLAWPLPPSMDDEALERLLYGEIKTEPSRPLPDMKWVHTELSKKNVTLALIWEERGGRVSLDRFLRFLSGKPLITLPLVFGPTYPSRPRRAFCSQGSDACVLCCRTGSSW